MKPRKHPIFLAVFIAFAVITTVPFSANAERLPVRTFTSADGLGSSFVDYIYRDSRGFMWFCTRDGLSRFDGAGFVTYEIGDQAAPPGIENIFEAADGTYWMSTTGGTYKFDPKKISQPEGDRPRLNAEKITNQRGSFFQDKDGILWLMSNSLFRYEEKDQGGNFIRVPLDIPRRNDDTFIAFHMLEAADGSVWIQTSWGLVRRMTDGRTVFYPHKEYLPGGSSDILADRDGNLWITIGREIFVLRPEPAGSIADTGPLIIKDLEPSKTIEITDGKAFPLPTESGQVFNYSSKTMVEPFASKRVWQTADGDIWLTAEKYLLQISKGELRAYTGAQGLPGVIARIGEDTAGNVWIGGHSLLARLDRNGFVTFGASDGSGSSRFFSVTESPDGSLYFGQGEFSVARYDGRTFKSVRPDLPRLPRPMWTSRIVFRSSAGDIWILSSVGLFRFRNVSDLNQLDGRPPDDIYDSSTSLRSDGAFQIFEDSKKNIWLSTRGNSADANGLAILPAGESGFVDLTERFETKGKRAVSSFAEDRAGNIWFGFYDGGIARFNGESFVILDKNNGLPEDGLISDLLIDKSGRLWMASTNFGVFRLDDVNDQNFTLVSIGTAQGLSSSNVRTLTEDNFGRIYAGTARGVDRITTDTMAIKHFSVTDGLAADFVVDSHRDRNGDLWFVTNNGVSRFIPRLEERSPPPRILIGDVRIAGIQQPVSQLGEISIDRGEISHTENNVQIAYFGLDFRAGTSLRFQQRLEGADDDWGPITDSTRITYANLVPGSYRFAVRAINDEGTISDVPASVSFVILRPYWQRWWFVLGAVVLISILIYTFFLYRTEHLRRINKALSDARSAEEDLRKVREDRLRELESIRARIATDLHDDIGSSLTQIAVLSEVAQTRAAQGNGGAAGPLSRISMVSNDLVGTMSDIVWSINPDKDQLSDLVQRMRRFAADVLSSSGIAFTLSSPPDIDQLSAGSNIRRSVFLIFKEAINNIAKHSEAKTVSVTLNVDDSFMILTIEDDGVGIKPNGSGGLGGNGIINMRKRAAETGGTIEFTSHELGTKVELRVPFAINPRSRIA